jgi:hypothetical protein
MSEIANEAKRRKTCYAAFRSAFTGAESLDLTALESYVDKLSQREKEWLLVSKFGFTQVNQVCAHLSRIPESVTSSQRGQLLSCLPLSAEDVNSISHFILDHCPHLLVKGRCQV